MVYMRAGEEATVRVVDISEDVMTDVRNMLSRTCGTAAVVISTEAEMVHVSTKTSNIYIQGL